MVEPRTVVDQAVAPVVDQTVALVVVLLAALWLRGPNLPLPHVRVDGEHHQAKVLQQIKQLAEGGRATVELAQARTQSLQHAANAALGDRVRRDKDKPWAFAGRIAWDNAVATSPTPKSLHSKDLEPKDLQQVYRIHKDERRPQTCFMPEKHGLTNHNTRQGKGNVGKSKAQRGDTGETEKNMQGHQKGT